MTKLAYIQRNVKLKCPHCLALFAVTELCSHVASEHPLQKQLTHKQLKKLISRQLRRAQEKKKRLARKRRLESMPPLMCQECQAPVPRGQFKQHLIEKHGASDIILSKTKSRKRGGRTLYEVSNISHPWQGGAPGLGKNR